MHSLPEWTANGLLLHMTDEPYTIIETERVKPSAGLARSHIPCSSRSSPKYRLSLSNCKHVSTRTKLNHGCTRIYTDEATKHNWNRVKISVH